MTKARDIASAIPAPSTVDATELGHLDGVTSAIQTQVDAKTAKATLTTKGDIYAASAASTPTRLAVGSNGQVLTANSATATGLEFATPASGGMTLLSTTTLSGASTTISSISGSYKDLRIEIRGVNVAAAAFTTLLPNGNGSISHTVNVGADDAIGIIGDRLYASTIRPTNSRDLTAGVTTNTCVITIRNYSSVVSNKNIIGSVWSKMTGRELAFAIVGAVNTTSAITSLVFGLSASTYSGGTVLLYGVN